MFLRKEKSFVVKGRIEAEVIKHTNGQSYKAFTIIIYESRVINISNLLVITTVES